MIVSWGEVQREFEQDSHIHVVDVDEDSMTCELDDLDFNTLAALSSAMDKHGLRVGNHVWGERSIEVYLIPDR